MQTAELQSGSGSWKCPCVKSAAESGQQLMNKSHRRVLTHRCDVQLILKQSRQSQ